jgi:long-chain acyl-CoA synthetase
VRELTVASGVRSITQVNIADYVFDNVEAHPDRVALRRGQDASWTPVTSAEFGAEVVALAAGLMAAGIEAGDRVAIMSRTRYEWTLADLAVLSIGAVVVPIYETSSAEQIEWIMSDSGATAAFVESQAHEAMVRTAAPDVTRIWRFDGDGLQRLSRADGDDAVHARRRSVAPDALASIIYTSGTTGRPRGCELTHHNLVSEVAEVSSELDALFNDQGSTLLFIPIAHVFGRAIQLGALATGTVLGHTPDTTHLVDDLGGFAPTFVLSVPRVFEKVYNTARQHAQADGKGKIFAAAERTAISYSEALDRGSVPLLLGARHKLFDALVYGKLRAALGGRCTAAISGGAPLGARLGHFFRGVGVTIYEGYGLTETTAGICVNRPGAIRIGTVGRPITGASARIADDGELIMRSGVVFRGYWRNEAATREALDADGWFRTGDIGNIDDDGYVRITGRKKEIIVTAAGKNVAPAVLEDRARAHWLISQCLVVGDGEPFIAALVTIDPESFPTWLSRTGRPADTEVADVVDDPDLIAEIQTAIDDANKAVSRAESIRKFAILPNDWTEATGELTPSLKVKRNVVQQEFADDIAKLYAQPR